MQWTVVISYDATIEANTHAEAMSKMWAGVRDGSIMPSHVEAEVDLGSAPETPDRGQWTVESVRALGLATTIDNAASVLGISRTLAYAMAKRGEFPVKLVRTGRRYLVPTQALLDLMGQENP